MASKSKSSDKAPSSRAGAARGGKRDARETVSPHTGETSEKEPNVAPACADQGRLQPVSPSAECAVPSQVRAAAERQLFGATGEGIVWAVVGGGIDSMHPHFQKHQNLVLDALLIHRSFTDRQFPASSEEIEALVDPNSHTTHVAGVIAGLKSMFLSRVKLVMTAATTVAALAAGAIALAQSPIGNLKDGNVKPQRTGSPNWTYHILVSRNGEPPRKLAVVEMTSDKPISVDAPGALILFQPKREAAAKRPMDVMYVNVYSTDGGINQDFLHNFATSKILPEIKSTRGISQAHILGNRIFAMRVSLNPDRMRANNLSSEDVTKALLEQGMSRTLTSPERLDQTTGKTLQSKDLVLTYIGRYNKREQYGNTVLKANPVGEILRLKDVSEVELGPQSFDIYSDIDGHPSATIVIKQAPGWSAATLIEEVKKKLEQIKKNSFPAGMNFEVTTDVSAFLDASEDQRLIYAGIQTPPGSTLEYTSAKSHEVQAIAKSIEGVTSVSSIAGYDVLTEGQGSNKGTCLIKLKNRPSRKLTSRQIIEVLEEQCRTISNVKLEFFEPAAVPKLREHHP